MLAINDEKDNSSLKDKLTSWINIDESRAVFATYIKAIGFLVVFKTLVEEVKLKFLIKLQIQNSLRKLNLFVDRKANFGLQLRCWLTLNFLEVLLENLKYSNLL